VKKLYQNSPISEVVCEFQFGQDTLWDLTIPGLLYEKVRALFPKHSQAAIISMDILINQENVGQRIGSAPIMRFLTEDERFLMQVGAYLLSVNHLKPYSSWQTFLPLIEKSFTAYRDVATPKSIHRLGLRYVNVIEISDQNLTLSDYFEFLPSIGAHLPAINGPFLLGVQFPFESTRDVAKVQLSSLSGIEASKTSILLDIDYFLAQPEKIEPDTSINWFDNAHTRVEEIFEACITDRLRDLFGR
jgi:uncharacterized protein (TIGR04255 family)